MASDNSPPPGRVFFVGAGPGDPELITVKGARLLKEAGFVLYAGSLVPRQIAELAGPGAVIQDSASMTLEQTHAFLYNGAQTGRTVVRLHTGDPAIYGCVAEQIALLERDEIPWSMIPGVTAAFAAAAAAGESFTLPGVTQSLVMTRLPGRTQTPPTEQLVDLARHGSSLAVYLSGADPAKLAEELKAAGLPQETRIVVAHKLGWEGEQILKTTLADFNPLIVPKYQTLYLVLPPKTKAAASKLYDKSFSHQHRTGES